jgi:hypothetical protein
MRLKKIPYYLALFLLTSGASLILGFLSFGGMFALWPVLPVAFSAFVLSVAYEGEIYLQNIKGALNKLLKYNFLQRQIAKDYLLENFPTTDEENCPQFFKDYEAQLNLLHQFGHKRLDTESKAEKKRIEKTLRDMEQWFALQLFSTDAGEAAYEIKLREWLAKHHQSEWQTKFDQLHSSFQRVKIFSVLAGIFMGFGTTYLLIEAFTAIPFMAAISLTLWPFMIVPMAAIAGAAYGLLTYNAVTDMIRNDTLRKWYDKIRNDLNAREGLTLRSVFMAVTAAVLLSLAVALTICTAGTWWTVVKETRPLFTWMGKMPGFIMGVIHPIITGLSAVVFNLQNTSESLELIDNATRAKENIFVRMGKSIQKGFEWLQANENWLQILNPFRLILKLTITPLRIVMFLGHLISIGVTADRVPGVSQVFSALLGIISEGFEDAHYFVGHDHGDDHDHDHHEAHDEHSHHHHHEGHDHHHEEHHHEAAKLSHTQMLLKERLGAGHSHNHDVDLPTRFIKLVFSPVYFLAASWDYLASQRNSHPKQALTFSRAWEKQMGEAEENHVTVEKTAPAPSSAWKIQQAIFRIERHKEKQLNGVWVGEDIAADKRSNLTQLQHDLTQIDPEDQEALSRRLATEKSKTSVYNKHRYFNQGPTSTETFLEELPQRVMGMAN